MIELPLWVKSFIHTFTYPAVFTLSLLGATSLFIPIPVVYTIIFFAKELGLNPWLIGLTAGMGSALGELTGYLVGLGSKELFKQKVGYKSKFFESTHKLLTHLFSRYGMVLIAFAALFPFFDAIGILAGMQRYDLRKFLLATAVGKCSKCLLVAYLGIVL